MFEYSESDKYIYDNEIRPYLPGKIFDAHTHLSSSKYSPDLYEVTSCITDKRLIEVDIDLLCKWWGVLFPDAEVKGLVFGHPTKQTDLAGANEFVATQCQDSNNRISLLTSPNIPCEVLEGWIKTYNPAGLKPYMCFSNVECSESASICDMIPEEQIALANKYNLAITLHVAKAKGMADEENLSEIIRLTSEYPDCNFILAHCGRCFLSPLMEKVLERLPVLENLWIDTSAVCDTGVFLQLFSKYDYKKILFGTDLVTAAGFRGAYVRMGMSWELVTPERVQRHDRPHLNATFVAYENLCAMLSAARFCNFNDTQINDIFYNNSQKLFSLGS
jgi:hypothetical protein